MEKDVPTIQRIENLLVYYYVA